MSNHQNPPQLGDTDTSQLSAMPGTAFLRLPNELLFLVAGYLDPRAPRWEDERPSDLCNLRLVSKRLSHAALPALVKRYFQHRCIMLQRNSLENLVAISGHPVFGPAVEHLSIRLYHWTSSPQLATSDPPREGTPAQEYVVEEEDMKEKDLEKEYAEEPGVDLQAYHRLMQDQRLMMDSCSWLTQHTWCMPSSHCRL